MATKTVIMVDTATCVKTERVADLLCSAMEGGSNYWYEIREFGKPEHVEPSWPNRFRSLEKDTEIFPHVDYPLNEGGYLMIGDKEDISVTPKRLDLDSIQKGLQVMQQKYPWHWANWIQENDDAETGDVFLQCCLFGEIVYG